jgi:UDP-glucose 4-epimerase
MMGEDHRPESHLIPRILTAARDNKPVAIYGTDYPTPDGTCVRDYIHIMDLAGAHILALESMGKSSGTGEVFNLGNGAGFSVCEIIEHSRAITGLAIETEDAPRRPGDAPVLVASSEKARRVLGWRPKYADIDTIIATAWRWHSGHPGGYEA